MKTITLILVNIILCVVCAGCVTLIDDALPYDRLPEITVATKVTLVASPSHPTVNLSVEPIQAGEKVQVIGMDNDAAWLLVLHNNQIGWMPTVFSRDNIGTLDVAITAEPLSAQCTKFLAETAEPEQSWRSDVEGSVIILGSIYRAQPTDGFGATLLTLGIKGNGIATDSDYLHIPLTSSSAIILFAFTVRDLNRSSEITFDISNPNAEPLSFQTVFFSNDCTDSHNTLSIGETKVMVTEQRTSIQDIGFTTVQTDSTRLQTSVPTSLVIRNPARLTVASTPTPTSNEATLSAALPQQWQEQEDNNGPSSAMQIALASSGRGIIEYVGDQDYFVFRASEVTWLNIEVKAQRNNSELDSELVLLNAAGESIAENDDTYGRDSFLQVALEPGRYYIVVRCHGNNDGSRNHFYNLVLNQIPTDNNDRADVADKVQYGTPIDSVISFWADTDFYYFEGNEGDLVDLQVLQPADSELDGHLTLFDMDMNILIENDDYFGNAPYVRYRLPYSGIYYVQVFEHGSDAGGTEYLYKLQLDLVESDQNDTLENAIEVVPDSIIRGVIDFPDDIDYFSFTTKKGETVHALVNTGELESQLDSFIVLLDAMGQELISNDDFRGRDAGIQYTIEEDGVYFLRVEEYEKNEGGFQYRYSLQLFVFPSD